MRESLRTRIFDRTPNWTTLYIYTVYLRSVGQNHNIRCILGILCREISKYTVIYSVLVRSDQPYIYGIFGKEITKYTVIYGVHIRFWRILLSMVRMCSSLSSSPLSIICVSNFDRDLCKTQYVKIYRDLCKTQYVKIWPGSKQNAVCAVCLLCGFPPPLCVHLHYASTSTMHYVPAAMCLLCAFPSPQAALCRKYGIHDWQGTGRHGNRKAWNRKAWNKKAWNRKE